MKMFDNEMIEKAKCASSVEELCKIAKENQVELTAEEAEEYFTQLNPKCGELDDDELDNVAGGACSQEDGEPKCPNCGTVLTSVDYCDGVDPRIYSYKLCYGCGSYGYYYNIGDGWTKLPENRVQYLVAETSK